MDAGRAELTHAADDDAPNPYVLHFCRPAAKWPTALPVGNGRLGAMVFGEPSLERIQLNEESIWDHEPGHQHIAHLFGLYPDDQITVDATPDLARAARVVLDKRLAAGGGSTGWSRSWIINCFARLRDGETADASVLALFRQSTLPNLFDVCGTTETSPFQIDGNLGTGHGC